MAISDVLLKQKQPNAHPKKCFYHLLTKGGLKSAVTPQGAQERGISSNNLHKVFPRFL